MKLAFIIMDMQNEFFENDDATTVASLKSAVEYINVALACVRAKHVPVIVVEDIAEGSREPGMPGFETHASINTLPADHRIAKRHGNAFWETDLDQLLKSLNIDTVFITGFAAEFCVLSTYHGAEERGYHPILLRNGIASFRPDRIRFVEDICNIISLGALQAVMNS